MTTPDPNLFNREYFGELPQGARQSEDYDLSYLLPKIFLTSDMWRDLIEAMSKVIDESVHTPISNLATIRVPESQGRSFKRQHAAMMGYDIDESVMSDAAYDRLNNNIGEYLYEQGKDSFISFLGYVAGMKLGLVRLWTKDYITFHASPGGNKTVFDGGDWYPTTHVGVIYDENDNVSTKPPMTEAQIVAKFYDEAPIDLVLAWIAKSQTMLIGTLYIQIMSHTNTHMTFRVDARGELVVTVAMEAIDLSAAATRFELLAPMCLNEIAITANAQMLTCDTIEIQSTVNAWSAGHNLIPHFWMNRRESTSSLFSGVGSISWVNNATRLHHNPTSGVELGLLLEPDSYNFVKSSTAAHKSPWVLEGGASSANVSGLDGSVIKQWTVNSGAPFLYQILSLPAGIYTAQCIAKNCAPFIGSVISETLVETGEAFPAPELKSVFSANSLGAFSSAPVGASHLRHTLTFTLTSPTSVMIKCPLANGSRIYYFGIEPGNVATSPISTDDCNAGSRIGDIMYRYLDEEGALGFRIKGINFVGGATQPSYVATVRDSSNAIRAIITRTTGLTRVVYIDLISGEYIHFNYDFVGGLTDRIIVAWSPDNLSVSANGSVSEYALRDFTMSSISVAPQTTICIDRYLSSPYGDLEAVQTVIG